MKRPNISKQLSTAALTFTSMLAVASPPAHSQQIEEVIVTARKTSENLQRIPVAVTAISPEGMKQANIQTALDFKLVTPGLQSAQSAIDNSNINFKIRGISAGNGFAESAVATYIDGVFQQLQFGLAASLYDLQRVEVLKGAQGTLYGKNTPAGLVNIITRKPELDKVGGFVTLNGGTYSGGGSGNRKAGSVQAALNTPLVPGKLAVRVSADVDSNDGFGRNYGGSGRILNNHVNNALRGQVLFAPNDDWKILLSGDYSSFHSNNQTQRTAEASPGALAISLGIAAGYIRFADALPVLTGSGAPGPTFGPGVAQAIALMSRDFAPGANFYNANGTFGYAFIKNKGVSLTVDGKLNDDISVKSISAYRNVQRHSGNDLDGTTLHEFETTTRDLADFVSQELNLLGKAGPVDWQTGVYYSYFKDTSGGEPGLDNAVLTNLTGSLTGYGVLQKTNTVGVFAHGVYHITDALDLSAGLRWSQDSRAYTPMDRKFALDATTLVGCADTAYGGTVANQCVGPIRRHKDHGISYDVALNYQISPDLMVYGKTARGYKAGNINVNGGYTDFQPETVQDWEVGLKSEWLDRTVLMNLAGYYIKYSNIQRTVVVSFPDGTTGSTTNNAAKAHITGLEVESIFRPAHGFELGVNYAYTAPKYDAYLNGGVDLSGEAFEIAKHTINAHVQYGIEVNSTDTLTARLDWVWQSRIVFGAYTDLFPSEAILQQGAYGIVNARIAYNIEPWDTSVALYSRNLGGKKYYVGATGLRSVGTSFITPGEPRFIGIEITKKFGDG